MEFIKKLDFDFIEFLPFIERPFKAKFIPSKVWKDLDDYKNNFVELKNYTKRWRTKVEFIDDEEIDVGGEYDSVDKRITLYVYANDLNDVKFDDEFMTWNGFKYAFIQTMMHELIHYMQYTNRYDESYTKFYSYIIDDDEEVTEIRNYYAALDEIQAYAHCIYLDSKLSMTETSMNELLKYKKYNPTYFHILSVFEYDFKEGTVLKKLTKEIIRIDNKYNKKFREGGNYGTL